MGIQAILPLLGTLADKVFDTKEKADEFKAAMDRAAADVIMTEAKGESWLQRNWRPITMLFFLVLLGSYWFGYAPEYLIENPSVVERVFFLLQIGIGGYIGGRSVEKIAKEIAPVLKEKRKYND
jgi:hypothetical protein